MLGSLKRLFVKPADDRADYPEVAEWAKRRGHGFKRVRDDDGFIVEGVLDSQPWRMEWGLSQRPYIEGNELRLRMDLKLPEDMHLLLLSQPLMEALERQTFEEFVDSVQTQIGSTIPEEMRWLVMYPKVNLASLKNLRQHFGAVASQPEVGLAWLDGPLASTLERANSGALHGSPPFVLMTLRGRVYLRLQLKEPDARVLTDVLALFETAVAQALRAAPGVTDQSSSWNSGASTAWQNLQAPELDVPRKLE